MTAGSGFPAPGHGGHDQGQRYAAAPGAAPQGAPAWTGYPHQPQFLAVHRPGIVPLRPLSVGDILDGAVKAVRHDPKSMIGLSAVVIAVFMIPSVAISLWLNTSLSGALAHSTDEVAGALAMSAMMAQLLFSQLATVILTGLLIHVVGAAVLGRRPGIAETWRRTRGRLLPLIGLNLVIGLAVLLLGGALLSPGVLLLATGNSVTGVLLTMFGALLLLLGGLAVAVKTAMAGPIVVLEQHGIATALHRSWSLTRGAFWRILGISLLAALIAGVIGVMLQIPFSLAGLVALGASGRDTDLTALGPTFIDHLGQLVTGAVTTPFVAAVTGLLYIDRRIRLEALDVVLVRDAQAGATDRG